MRVFNPHLPVHLVDAAALSHATVSAAFTQALHALTADPAQVIASVFDHRADTDPFNPTERQTCVYIDSDLVTGTQHLASYTGLSTGQLTSIALEHHLLTIGAFPEHDGYTLPPFSIKPGTATTVPLYEEDLPALQNRGRTTSEALHRTLAALAADHTVVAKALVKALDMKKHASNQGKQVKRVSFKAHQAHLAAVNSMSIHFDLQISQMIRLQLHT